MNNGNVQSQGQNPRIQPLEKPPTLYGRLIYALLKRTYGKVITPAKVIYARYPEIGLAVRNLEKTTNGFTLLSDYEKLLIKLYVAFLNNCAFCLDLGKRNLLRAHKRTGIIDAFPDFEQSPDLSVEEKAMLAYVNEFIRNMEVSDETWKRVRQYFSEEKIIEITFTANAENFLNRLLKPFRIGSDHLCSL